MERNVIVINSSTQTKVQFTSNATTFAELKEEIRNQGISITDQVFYEGISRVEFTNDNQVLPTNMPWKGGLTNDLIVNMTAPKRKIVNGTMTRSELYAYIKKNNLQNTVKEKFGRNFTQCSTENLLSLVKVKSTRSETTQSIGINHKPKVSVDKSPVVNENTESTNSNSFTVDPYKLGNLLVKKGVISLEEFKTTEVKMVRTSVTLDDLK